MLQNGVASRGQMRVTVAETCSSLNNQHPALNLYWKNIEAQAPVYGLGFMTGQDNAPLCLPSFIGS